jgi:hypothetical protein
MATSVQTRPDGGIRRWWPVASGVVMAGFAGLDLTTDGGVELAPVLAASAVIYLGAAALQRPRATWPVFFGAFAVLAVAGAVPGLPDATWLLLGAAAVFVVYGLLRGATRPATGLPLQTLAMAGFGGVAVLALAVHPDLGAYLVAAGLLGHAAWDVYHHRTGRVVARSLAEFCVVLDTLLAMAIVVATAMA